MDLNMKVLIVDDFATMRRILRNILRQAGFTRISESDDGKNALEELRKGLGEERFDLVLCDWNMPGMSGLELLKIVRADPDLKNMAFVLVTAGVQKDNIVEAVQAGVDSYVVKPFTAKTISKGLTDVFGE